MRIFVVFSVLMLSGSVSAFTSISSCGTLDTAGEYYQLDQDLAYLAATGNCLEITADDIILDCAGFTIDGIDASSISGVYAETQGNITIVNCTITDFTNAIRFDTVANSSIMNSTLTSCYLGNALYLLNSTNNSIHNNQITNNNGGIYLSYSPNNSIFGNDISANAVAALAMNFGCNNSIDTTNLAGDTGEPLLYLHDASGLIIQNNASLGQLVLCNVTHSIVRNITMTGDDGILLHLSNNNSLYNNSVFNARNGFTLSQSYYNNVSNNTAIGNYNGFYLLLSRYNNLTNNSANFGTNGMALSQSRYNNISYNNLTNNAPGLSITLAGEPINCQNTIELSNMGGQSGDPVLYKHDTSGILIENNDTLSLILLCNVHNSRIRNITMTDDDGIHTVWSNNNTINDNHISGGLNSAISVRESSINNTVANNSISYNGAVGISVAYDSLEASIVNNTISNQTTSIAIYIWASADHATVVDNTVYNCSGGVTLNSVSHVLVSDNDLDGTERGIVASASVSQANISGNSISAVLQGVRIAYSSDINLTGNNISGADQGVYLTSASSNMIYSNNVPSPDTAIYLEDSPTNNQIYNNIFIAPTPAIETNTTSPYTSANSWNTSYNCALGPNILGGRCWGGNYYSNYSGIDVTGDGIGDTLLPYNIAGLANSQDLLPLTNRSLNATVTKLDQTILNASSGGTVRFLINLTNNGNRIVNVTIIDYLPVGLNYTSSNITPDKISGNNITWNATDLQPGASFVILLNTTVNSSVATAITPVVNLTNVVESYTRINSTDTFNSTSSANATIYYAALSSIKIDITPSPPAPGGIVQFSLNITNTGNVTLNTVRVVDTLPLGLTFDSSDPVPDSIAGQSLTWDDVGPLAPGAWTLIHLNATVDLGASGALQNNVSVDASPPNGDNTTDNDSATVGIGVPAINVVKTASDSTLTEGDQVTFTITITNTGQLNLTTVMATDELPAGLDFVSSSIVPNETDPLLWYNLSNLSVGSSIQHTITADAPSKGTYTNTITVVGKPQNGDNVTDAANAEITVQKKKDGPIRRGVEPIYIPPEPEPEPEPEPIGGDEYRISLLRIKAGNVNLYAQDVQPERLEINIGQTKEVEVEVRNTGTLLLRNLRLEARDSDCLRIDKVEPSSIGVLTVGESKYFTLTVTGISECETSLDIIVRSNEATDDELIHAVVKKGAVVTVPVKPSPKPTPMIPDWLVPLLPILLLIVLSLFLLWWFRASRKREQGLRGL